MKCYKYNNIMNPSSKGLQFSQKHVMMQPYGICIVDLCALLCRTRIELEELMYLGHVKYYYITQYK